MENNQLLIEAMEYIEDNLSQPLKTDISDFYIISKEPNLHNTDSAP